MCSVLSKAQSFLSVVYGLANLRSGTSTPIHPFAERHSREQLVCVPCVPSSLACRWTLRPWHNGNESRLALERRMLIASLQKFCPEATEWRTLEWENGGLFYPSKPIMAVQIMLGHCTGLSISPACLVPWAGVPKASHKSNGRSPCRPCLSCTDHTKCTFKSYLCLGYQYFNLLNQYHSLLYGKDRSEDLIGIGLQPWPAK